MAVCSGWGGTGGRRTGFQEPNGPTSTHQVARPPHVSWPTLDLSSPISSPPVPGAGLVSGREMTVASEEPRGSCGSGNSPAIASGSPGLRKRVLTVALGPTSNGPFWPSTQKGEGLDHQC